MRVLVVLTDGFEEIEAFTPVDVLRRAGADVTVAGLVSSIVEGAHKVKVMTDKKLSDVDANTYDMLVLPGGPGYRSLLNSSAVINLVKDFNRKKKFIAAICMAPAVLAKAGVLDDKIATIYPGAESQLPKPREAKVIVAGNIITSRSPGTAMDFALKLAEIAADKQTAQNIRTKMVV